MRTTANADSGLLLTIATAGCGAGTNQVEAEPEELGMAEDKGEADLAPPESEPTRPVVQEIPDSQPAAVESGAAGATGADVVDCSDEDEPDDGFEDSNCDGIDGDASQAVFVSPKRFGPGRRQPRRAGSHDPARPGAGPDLGQGRLRMQRHLRRERGRRGHGVRLYGGYACGDGWRRGSSGR